MFTKAVLLRVLIGGLGILLALEWLIPVSEPEARATGEMRFVGAAHPAALHSGLTEHFANIALARPLFSQSRRPPETRLTGRGPDALPRLSGIIIAGLQRHAIFEGGGKPVIRAVGDHLGDYRIIAIAPADVTVSGPEGTQLVSLGFDAARRSVVTASVAGGDLLEQFRSHRPPNIPVPRPPSMAQMLARLPHRDGG